LDDISIGDVTGVHLITDQSPDIYAYGNAVYIVMPVNKVAHVSVYDMSGRLIASRTFSEGYTHILPLNTIQGVYIVSMLSEDQLHIRKVFIF
jgi:hypothetical protein